MRSSFVINTVQGCGDGACTYTDPKSVRCHNKNLKLIFGKFIMCCTKVHDASNKFSPAGLLVYCK